MLDGGVVLSLVFVYESPCVPHFGKIRINGNDLIQVLQGGIVLVKSRVGECPIEIGFQQIVINAEGQAV